MKLNERRRKNQTRIQIDPVFKFIFLLIEIEMRNEMK